MKNVFVAGGSGFIGNAVALAFKKRGDHVVCLCNTQQSKETLEKLRQVICLLKKNISKYDYWPNAPVSVFQPEFNTTGFSRLSIN